jgi:exodeoxyribonuclease VII small subunit
MKSKQTYKEAYTKLEELVEQLEDGNIPLDKLAEKVKQANEWIAVCEDKLRQIGTDIDEAAATASDRPKRKK